MDGKQVSVHPAYRFNNEEWFTLPEPVRTQLTEMRVSYRNSKKARSVAETQSHFNTAPTFQYQIPLPPPPPVSQIPLPPLHVGQVSQVSNPPDDDASHMSGVTIGTQMQSQYSNIMGGRNQQANLRSRKGHPSIGNVITKRKVCEAITHMPEPGPNLIANNVADSNADTCCVGTNLVPIAYTNRSADIYPYSDSYTPMKNVPIVSAATAYDHCDGTTYILVVHEALYYGT